MATTPNMSNDVESRITLKLKHNGKGPASSVSTTTSLDNGCIETSIKIVIVRIDYTE